MATAIPTYGAIIPVNVRSNDAECSDLVVQCLREWSIERVKQEVERKHPKHYPTHAQVIYYCGSRIEDTELLTNLFQGVQCSQTKPQYTLWLAVVLENRVFQEFLSLPKSDTPHTDVEYPDMDSTHPYFAALKYYNYLTSAQSQMKSSVKEIKTSNDPAPGEPAPPPTAEANAAGENVEGNQNQNQNQGQVQNQNQGQVQGQREGDFNFLGGRLDRARGIGPEEAQEQNAIVNAINLLVRLSLFLYITYHYAPQYKFYLVIGFSAVMFIYQLGLFRVNRVNIRRYQVVEEEVRARGEERPNGGDNNGNTENTTENAAENNELTTKTTEITPNSDGLSQNTDEPTPKLDGLSPNTDELTPNTDGISPKPDGLSPKPDGISPNTDEITPNTGEIQVAQVTSEITSKPLIKNDGAVVNTPNPDTNQGNSVIGVLKSLLTLSYNLILSFNPEFNIQEAQ